MILYFIADYNDRDGQSLHASFQVATNTFVPMPLIVRGACDQLRDRGFEPVAIYCVPGMYTPEELEEIALHGPVDIMQPVYVSPELLARMERRKGS